MYVGRIVIIPLAVVLGVVIIISPTFQNLLHQMQLSCVMLDELTVTIKLIDPFSVTLRMLRFGKEILLHGISGGNGHRLRPKK